MEKVWHSAGHAEGRGMDGRHSRTPAIQPVAEPGFFQRGADFVDGEGADFSAGPDLLYKDEN